MSIRIPEFFTQVDSEIQRLVSCNSHPQNVKTKMFNKMTNCFFLYVANTSNHHFTASTNLARSRNHLSGEGIHELTESIYLHDVN
jgi:hypothetical protein